MGFPFRIETSTKLHEFSSFVLCQPRWGGCRQEISKVWGCNGFLNAWLWDLCKLKTCEDCASGSGSHWNNSSSCGCRARFLGSISLMCKFILAHFFQQEFNPLALFCKLIETDWVFFAYDQLLLDCIIVFFNKIINEGLFAMIKLSSEALKFDPELIKVTISLPYSTISSACCLFLVKIAKSRSQSLKHLIGHYEWLCCVFSKTKL